MVTLLDRTQSKTFASTTHNACSNQPTNNVCYRSKQCVGLTLFHDKQRSVRYLNRQGNVFVDNGNQQFSD